jgi:hypothetical protein
VPLDADSLAALGELASTSGRAPGESGEPVAVDEQVTVAVRVDRARPRSLADRVADRLTAIPALRSPSEVPVVAAVGALPRRTQLSVLAGISVAAGLLAGLVVPVASASTVTTAAAGSPAAAPASTTASAATAGSTRTSGTTAAGSRSSSTKPSSTKPSGSKATGSKATGSKASGAKAGSTAAAPTSARSGSARGAGATTAAALASTLPALGATTGLDWSAAAPARGTSARAPRALPAAGWVRESRPVRPTAATIAAARAYKPTRKLPADSGTGRRIVYAQHRGHVWVVGADGLVVRDYPVTGRIGRPSPGSYRVFSKSPTAVNPIAKVRFDLMVRFAHGITGAAIGFHTIPRWYDGRPIQRENQLGQMIGAGGCVRQSKADARWLYRWAKVGDRVVVLR